MHVAWDLSACEGRGGVQAKPVVEDGACMPAYNVKHMAAGRLAIEAPYVMPDGRTVYITDDGDNVMFGMFIASVAGDLSCGSTYGAKFTQTDAAGGMSPPLPPAAHVTAPYNTLEFVHIAVPASGPPTHAGIAPIAGGFRGSAYVFA